MTDTARQYAPSAFSDILEGEAVLSRLSERVGTPSFELLIVCTSALTDDF